MIGCLLAISACAHRSTLSPEVRESIDSMVAAAYPNDDEPGCSVAVIRDGRIVHTVSRGVTSLDAPEPIGPETNFRIASVTKQFTAMSILILADRGALSLDDPVTKWLPELSPWADAATIRNLLQHTSGLKTYENHLPDDLETPVLDAGVVRVLAVNPGLVFDPGTQYSYSNSGYACLSIVVERASGNTFAGFLRDEIFRPLGMDGTVAFENGISTVPNRAYGYRQEESGLVFADQSMTSSVLGDGGIYTSVTDYAKWDEALYGHPILPPGHLADAFVNGALTDGTPIEYGYGWRIEQYPYGEVAWHTGGTTGFNHCVRRFPAERLTVVFFANRNGEEPKALCGGIMEAIVTAPR